MKKEKNAEKDKERQVNAEILPSKVILLKNVVYFKKACEDFSFQFFSFCIVYSFFYLFMEVAVVVCAS